LNRDVPPIKVWADKLPRLIKQRKIERIFLSIGNYIPRGKPLVLSGAASQPINTVNLRVSERG